MIISIDSMVVQWAVLLVLFGLVHCEEDNQVVSTTQDNVGTYGLYNGCPDGSYYAHVTGIEIHCEPYPWPKSKHNLCWGDLWWKMQERNESDPISITNPFHVIPTTACRAKCLCKLSLDLNKFQCQDKGARLGWKKYPPSYTTYKPIFQCVQFQLPDIFNTLPMDSVELVIAFHNVPSTFSQMKIENQNFHSLAWTILHSGYPINGWIVNVDDNPSKTGSFDTTEFFLYNLSFSNALHRLDIINTPMEPQMITTNSLKFSDLDLILSNFTGSLEFLKLDGFDISTIPDRSSPPFLNSLKSIIVKNAPNFVRMPSWIWESKNLVILALDRVSNTFDWDSLKSIPSLKYFSFTNTPVANLPVQLNFSLLFPQLEYLDLSNLNLSTIGKNLVSDLASIRYLDLSGNNLAIIPSFSGLKRLEWLGLAGISGRWTNDRTECAYGPTKRINFDPSNFIDLSNLITLDISYFEFVNVSEDAFDRLINLEILNAVCVGWNKIPISLKNACHLRQLHLASNNLNGPDAVPDFLITQFSSLSQLDLRNNSLTTLPPRLLSFPNPSDQLIQSIKISISGNPMNGSNCEMNKIHVAYNSPIRQNGTDQCGAVEKEKMNTTIGEKTCKTKIPKMMIVVKGNADRALITGLLLHSMIAVSMSGLIWANL